MQPHFTPEEIDELRRVDAKLDWLPRLRMQTVVGRWALNALLRVYETATAVRHPRASFPETRMLEHSGRRVPARIFRPGGPAERVIVDLHGGGWTIGNARMNDVVNAALAERLNAVVIAIDYKLALSHAVTDVITDCAAAICWTIESAASELGRGPIVVRGSSAGAHLAAGAMLGVRDAGRADAVAGVLLLFGLYDFGGTDMVRAASDNILLLHGPTVRRTLRKLTPDMSDEQRRLPPLSPLYGDLNNMPPALFAAGTRDMLLDDSRLMAARWQAASGNAELLVVPEAPHAFDRLDTAVTRKTMAYVDEWICARKSPADRSAGLDSRHVDATSSVLA